MKLRNKKTGEITSDFDWDFVGLVLKVDHSDDTIEMDDKIEYHSLAELNEDWEDYKPAEPLIKDEKSRKVFQEWVKLYDAERFRVTHLFNSKGHITVLRSTDLTTEPSIELPGHIGKDSEIYTRVELCGEEEG